MSGNTMLSVIVSGVRALRLQNYSNAYRLSPRFATSFSQSLDADENVREQKRGRNAEATHVEFNVDKNTKFHQPRGSSADVFGDLSSTVEVPADLVEGDEADKAEGTTYSREQDREKRRVHYSKLITELLSEKKFSMALEVLETEMKAVKAKPDRQIFVELITFCGKVGYPQKAFSLFNQMKKRGYDVTGAVYTSLYNSCANCPDKHVGLKYAERVKKTMNDKGWKPNVITYNAMIKAFGRNGDRETAFFLADEMMREKIPLEIKTMSFLLQACISNKESGFCDALQVWHKMRQYRLKPEVMSYNLLLRAARDSGMGSLESVGAVFKHLMPDAEPLKLTAKDEPIVNVGESDGSYPWDLADPSIVHGSPDTQSKLSQQTDSSDSVKSSIRNAADDDIHSARPNLLALKPSLGGLVIMDEITSASDRLILLGGSQGVVESMLADGIEPDIKTYTLLLDCIPQTTTAEQRLLQEMKKNQVQPDTGFFNALIYRRGRRQSFRDGFDVLDMMKEYDVGIDNITVHTLAFCVSDIQSFHKFLDDIRDAGFSPTTPMLGSVMKNALSQTHFKFIHCVMDAYAKYELGVHKSTSDQIDAFYKRNVRLLKGKDTPPAHKEKFYASEYFKTGMKLFICKITDWRRRVKLDETSDADYHDQFKKTGKEAEQLEPYLQKWHKGSRYTEWRRRKRPATAN